MNDDVTALRNEASRDIPDDMPPDTIGWLKYASEEIERLHAERDALRAELAAERERTESLSAKLSNRLLYKEPYPNAYPGLASVEDWLNGRGYTGEAGACHEAMVKLEYLTARAEAAEASVTKLREALEVLRLYIDPLDIPDDELAEVDAVLDRADKAELTNEAHCTVIEDYTSDATKLREALKRAKAFLPEPSKQVAVSALKTLHADIDAILKETGGSDGR
jgi:hypothetical protein